MSDAVPPASRSRASLWLIVALVVAPVAASYLLYYFWEPAHTVNYGKLIEPRRLPDVPLALADGSPFRLSQLKGKWVLVSVDAGRCDASCDRKLLFMRQLRLSQGKEMERVERAWLISDNAAPRAEAVAAYGGTWLVRAREALPRLFPAAEQVSEHIYVIDPLGNLMLRFPPDPDPRGMMQDLRRLLRASQVG